MNKKFSVVLIILLLLAGAAAAFFTLKLDKPIFEAKIKRGIEAIHERAQAQGRDLRVSYESVDVQGNWFKRQAILRNVLVITSNAGKEMAFLIPEVLYAPQSITF